MLLGLAMLGLREVAAQSDSRDAGLRGGEGWKGEDVGECDDTCGAGGSKLGDPCKTNSDCKAPRVARGCNCIGGSVISGHRAPVLIVIVLLAAVVVVCVCICSMDERPQTARHEHHKRAQEKAGEHSQMHSAPEQAAEQLDSVATPRP